MTTQLRLVDPPETPRPARDKAATPAPASVRRSAAPRRGVAVGRTVRTARKAASWGDWRLDASTRRVGRAGVAEARRALEAVIEQGLSQAS